MEKGETTGIDDQQGDGPPEPYRTYLPIGFTLVAAGLLWVHIRGGNTVDDTSITLLGVAVIVWFMPLVTRIKIGGSEIELGQRVGRLEVAKDQNLERLRDLEEREASLKETIAALEAANEKSEALLEMVADASRDADESSAVVDEQLPDDQEAVLRALADPRYTLRTVTGVFKAVRKEGQVKFNYRGEVEAILNLLLQTGFARSATGKSQTTVWGLTPQGRAQVEKGT
jgi:hypothetical protein